MKGWRKERVTGCVSKCTYDDVSLKLSKRSGHSAFSEPWLIYQCLTTEVSTLRKPDQQSRALDFCKFQSQVKQTGFFACCWIFCCLDKVVRPTRTWQTAGQTAILRWLLAQNVHLSSRYGNKASENTEVENRLRKQSGRVSSVAHLIRKKKPEVTVTKSLSSWGSEIWRQWFLCKAISGAERCVGHCFRRRNNKSNVWILYSVLSSTERTFVVATKVWLCRPHPEKRFQPLAIKYFPPSMNLQLQDDQISSFSLDISTEQKSLQWTSSPQANAKVILSCLAPQACEHNNKQHNASMFNGLEVSCKLIRTQLNWCGFLQWTPALFAGTRMRHELTQRQWPKANGDTKQIKSLWTKQECGVLKTFANAQPYRLNILITLGQKILRPDF